MKKLFRCLLTLSLSACALSACSLEDIFGGGESKAKVADHIEVRDYSSDVNQNSKYTFDGKVFAVYVDKSEENVTKKSTFSEVDTSELGTAKLTVSYEDSKYIHKKTVSLNIVDPKTNIALESISIPETINVNMGSSYSVNPTFTPSDATNKQVTYEIANTSIASVNAAGFITTKAVGTTTLTVTSKANSSIKATATLNVKAIALTGISIPDTFNVSLGKTKTVNPTFTPSNATNKEVTYSISNTSIASISSSGVITGKAAGSTTLTVTSVENSSIKTTATINVAEVVPDAWTVLIYMCGANLESDNGFATEDLGEILSVSGQPEDVNILVQTGGAYSWKKYGISSSYNQRYEVRNRALTCVNDKVYDSYKGMGEQNTLKDFLVWGLDEYPAEKTGLIFWNHGGGLEGCCFDEKKSNNGLTNNEVTGALQSAFTTLDLTEKLEFVGYDCCLMQMMEVAEFNSTYFNYQVGSEELENGTGWDYDSWVDDLYAGKSTTTILQAIVDGFIAANGGKNATGEYYQGQYYPADQTLSYLDLSKISTFRSKWETLATQISGKITSSNKSTFKNNVVGASRNFADNEGANFDCYHFLENLTGTTFDPGSTYISETMTALTNLVGYNLAQLEGSADAHGLSFYFGSSYNSSTYSHFTNWVSLVNTVGGFSSGGWY